ncbi:efflux RND transporter periplasmic adaptor subunit [Rhodobacter sp. Har01]|uniref:efflux RND transporter periplasmic adaptor subunit n=1 Tax=Rhodobacter sp. Har01 TaxID=2883999 RepID=UPI001D07DC3E|nr:efflux RND transporter periplasmic adaptor subunit [Rhodobacter sp. Har01]MCB6177208.1 efflux RND transporter periplasmic adaptor subunit [Rhodobacter sp. Har01]
MTSDTRPDLASLARMNPGRRFGRWVWLGLLLAVVAAGGWWWVNRPAATVVYDTTPARIGDLVVTVVATGNIQPTTSVDISSELSGTVAAVEVDYNDAVEVGQVLARLDDTTLKSRIITAEAQLAAARGKLVQAEATATETADTWASTEALDKRGLATRTTVIAAKAAHDRAAAAVQIASADLTLAEAALTEAKTDLGKAVIRAPIKGIVLDRAAEVGQIVAATLNAPVLFTLAEDLARMDLQVAVDEADIGRVKVGQTADFTVDAYPGQLFQATITSLRYAPDDTEDVVSYTAVLTVANDQLLLRPGMTATATIIVAEEAGVLLLPVAALRYSPPQTQSSTRSGRGLLGYIMPSRPPGAGSRASVDGSGVWVLRGGVPVRVKITPGATDGTDIVATSEELKEGDEVILSQREAD